MAYLFGLLFSHSLQILIEADHRVLGLQKADANLLVMPLMLSCPKTKGQIENEKQLDHLNLYQIAYLKQRPKRMLR